MQGSYARATCVEPALGKKADVIAVTNIDHDTVPAQEAFAMIMPLVKKCYQNYEQQKRSIGISISESYEDMAKGLASEERFAILSMAYESEQRELKTQIPELETTLNCTTGKADDLQKFIDRAKRITQLAKLTPEIVYEVH